MASPDAPARPPDRDTAAPERPPPGATAHVYVGGGSDVIHVLALDLGTGVLARRGTATAPRPAHASLSPDGSLLFVAGGTPPRVVPFTVDRGTGALAPVADGASPTGAVGPSHVAVHPGGHWVLVPHYASAEIAVLPVRAGGVLGAPADTERTYDEAQQAAVAPGGRFVLVPCRSGNAILQLQMDPATGELTRNDPPHVEAAAGAGPRRLAFHPGGRHVYVLEEWTAAITSYRFDPVRDTLSEPRTVRTAPTDVDERAAGHVAVHPGGRFLYASNRSHGSLAVFALEDGRPRPVAFEQAGGALRVPREFALDASGAWLVVANQGNGTVMALRVDPVGGRPSRVAEPLGGLGSPAFVVTLRK